MKIFILTFENPLGKISVGRFKAKDLESAKKAFYKLKGVGHRLINWKELKETT